MTHRGGLSLSIIIWRIGGGAKFPFALGPKNSLGGLGLEFAPGFVNYIKKGALDSQSQVIKFTSCLPMVDGSLWVLGLLPSLKLVAMI
jgi:hypothetical protein